MRHHALLWNNQSDRRIIARCSYYEASKVLSAGQNRREAFSSRFNGYSKMLGGSQSVESDDELFVPVVEQWKHNKSTIRAPHQLEIHKKKGDVFTVRL